MQLVALSYSPWSNKARWALDHHRVAYEYVEHVPMLGEGRLRRLAKRAGHTGRATVPMLVDGERVLVDSLAIARHAEERGGGSKLFPPEHEAEILTWNDRSERLLTAGRTLVVGKTVADRDAPLEGLPKFVPKFMHPMLRPLAARGARFFVKKYGLDGDFDAARARIRPDLDALRAALADGRTFLVGGTFSYADVTMALALQAVRPSDDARVGLLGPASRRCWTDEPLAAEYGELLAWRDRIVTAHR